jgi:hypothetical protein
MKKILFTLAVFGMIMGMSCDNDNVNNNEQPYFTVTYHGNGHTSGEPPVDTKKYKVPNRMKLPPEPGEEATILDKGTMEKEGYWFEGWAINSASYGNHIYTRQPGEKLSVYENTDIEAIWYYPNL